MPTNDCIKRSDALKAILGVSIYDTIEELDGARTIAENTWADGLWDAYKIIEEEVDAADVEPKRKWIPVSRGGYPKTGCDILMYGVDIYKGYFDTEINRFRLDDGYIIGGITHWMPLPEPPKSWTDNPWCNAVDKALEAEPPKGEDNAEVH